MKKSLLLGFAAIAMAASAQTVQTIPNTTPLQLDGAYTNITIATLPEDGSDPKARTKETDGVWQFDNMCNGDVAEFKLNNTKETPYVINFEVGCKIDGTELIMSLINTAGDVAWSKSVYPANNNSSWNKFFSNMAFVEDPLEIGEYTFRIEFLNEAGGSTNTANLRNFIFEARDQIVSYSLYTTVDPGDEAGRIVLSPSQNSYLEGTEVSITAQASTGYLFEKFEINGEEYTENPYTIYISESTDVVAYFTELKMDNDVPGWVNLQTRGAISKNPRIEEKTGVQVDGESYNDGASTPMLGNARNGDKESFELNVTQNGAYDFEVVFSSKANDGETPSVTFQVFDKAAYEEDPAAATCEWEYVLDATNAYNNWGKFTTKTVNGVNLTTGSKILLLTFAEPVKSKYTVNILKLGFGLNGDWGESGVENITVDNEPAVRRAYNAQGIEVAPTAKGLVIFSDGTKVFNK